MPSDVSPTAAPANPTCMKCNQVGTVRCGGCHSTLYCSKECQTNDWYVHKVLCKGMIEFGDSPGSTYRRAIYFPVNESTARLVWIPFDVKDWSMGNDYVRDNFFQGVEYLQYKYYEENPILQRELEYTIFLWHDDEFKINGQPKNQAMQSVSKVDLSRLWRGPLLAVMAQLDENGAVTDVLDITPDAVSVLADVVHLKTGHVNNPVVLQNPDIPFDAALSGSVREMMRRLADY